MYVLYVCNCFVYSIAELAGVNTAEKVKFAIVSIDRRFMERHQVSANNKLKSVRDLNLRLDISTDSRFSILTTLQAKW